MLPYLKVARAHANPSFNLVIFHLAIFQARGGGREPLFRLIPPGLILVAEMDGEMNGLALPMILKIIT